MSQPQPAGRQGVCPIPVDQATVEPRPEVQNVSAVAGREIVDHNLAAPAGAGRQNQAIDARSQSDVGQGYIANAHEVGALPGHHRGLIGGQYQDQVVAGSPLDGGADQAIIDNHAVVAFTATERNHAASYGQAVAAADDQTIVTRPAQQDIVAPNAVDQGIAVTAALQPVGSPVTGQQVFAGLAAQHIVSAAPGEDVVRRSAGQHVIAGRACDIGHCNAPHAVSALADC